MRGARVRVTEYIPERRDLAYKVARAAMRIQSDVLASSNKKNEKRENKNDTL